MTDPDIDTLIAELKELKERATPGTWKLWGGDVMADTKGTSDVKDAELVCRCPLKPNEYGGSHVRDAYYIAAMQRAMPALLRHIEDLTSERDATRAALDRATGPYVLDKEASESALRVIAEAQTARADKAEAELAAERARREAAEERAEAAEARVKELETQLARVRAETWEAAAKVCEAYADRHESTSNQYIHTLGEGAAACADLIREAGIEPTADRALAATAPMPAPHPSQEPPPHPAK